MLIHHAILLMLSWQCVRSIETEKPPPQDIFDQIATASENLGITFVSPDSSTKSPLESSSKNANKATTVHYENSNGFIPITSMAAILPSVSPESLDKNATAGDEDRASNGPASSGLVEDDPAYSTEARMFLNLGSPGPDRRSFDAQEGQNEFEILKVTNETPAIANYHDFYENMQNNLNRGRGGTETRYEQSEDAAGGRTGAQNQRTKQRIKSIEKYLTKHNTDQESRDSGTYNRYYPFSNANAKPLSSQDKAIFEPEKVQNSGNSFYDVYGENPSSRQRTSSVMRSNYDASNARHSQKSHGSSNTKNRHVNSKPVVVVEPSDYKLDMKYGSDQTVAKVSNVDHYRSQKHRSEPEVQVESRYEMESRANPEERYSLSYDRNEDSDYSDEVNDYMDVTEKPKRGHKSRRRPHSSDTSRRLPKEHRGHRSNSDNADDSRKHNSPTRAKLHRPKSKPSYWNDDDSSSPISDESSEEQHREKSPPGKKSEDQNSKKKGSKSKGTNNWSQIGPNIEVSHSNPFEIEGISKPKLLVPVNLNLVPLTGFDHSTAMNNGQNFDFTNVPNYVTASPVVSSPAPILSTSQSIVTPNIAHPPNAVKNMQNILNNYGMSTAVPDIIVGQNTYRNPVQALLLPQGNNKFQSNARPHYLPSTAAPMYTVTQTGNPTLHSVNPTAQSSSVENFHSTITPRTATVQNVHHLTITPAPPTTQPQYVMSQPTLQSFPVQNNYNGHENHNIYVNPNGLHGQNMIQQGHPNNHAGMIQYPQTSSTTPQPNVITNNNFHQHDLQTKKNSDGHYLASASYAVGNGQQNQQKTNVVTDNKYLPTTQHQQNMNQNNNNNYYNELFNNQPTVRPYQQQNIYQSYREDQNSNTKQYLQPTNQVPTMVQAVTSIPLHFDNQNYANGQLEAQQSVLNPTVVPHTTRDQNQQILKAANDIFENTWKQLQQLQSNDNAKNLAYQGGYRFNDNLGSTSNVVSNTANLLPGYGVNQVKAHLPILGPQNVEIVNPNIKPSPVDLTLINPYAGLGHYPAAVLTTPIPIFSTTAGFFTPRPAIASTSPDSIHLQNYVNSLTQIGAHSNQINKVEPRPDGYNQATGRPLYNPINFVPNLDLMKSQSMLNSKLAEPLPHQLNLVPLVPGGNFFKNTYGAQNELVHKPRLSSDLEKYAEEMFKESLKTIYSTHKWNNDRRLRGNHTASELNELAKLKSELQRFKASMPDPNYGGKDILEAHHSETKVRTAEPSKTTKKPDITIAALEQLFKAAAKHNAASADSSHGTRHKNRQNNGHTSSRPGSSSDHSIDYRNMHHLSDYLTPPKVNSFMSKSPFNDAPKPMKKRPGSGNSRYNSNGNSRTRSSSSRPAGIEAAASSHLESTHLNGPRYDKYQHRPSQYLREKDHHRHADVSDFRSDLGFDNYPTFTTTSSPEDDSITQSSDEHSSRDFFDINHPRTHNLLGLLMKNKQLPSGTAQTFFRDDEELRQYFENEKRRMQSQFYEENVKDFHKKADVNPVNMAPPAPAKTPQIRYYNGRHAA